MELFAKIFISIIAISIFSKKSSIVDVRLGFKYALNISEWEFLKKLSSNGSVDI